MSIDQSLTKTSRYGPFAAVLFDCDGVLVDSASACLETWTQWATRIGIARTSIIEKLEGRPIREAMSGLISPDRLDTEVKWFEAAELRSAKSLRAAPGAVQVVGGLCRAEWAVVTSASRALAQARLAAAGLPVPEVLVSADDVQTGKPDPDCYRLAAARLGVATDRCVAFEDSTVGARAARRAGATVVGVGTAIQSQFHIGPVIDLRSIRLRCLQPGSVELSVFSTEHAENLGER
jgi:mannitol-1-/sugar-/sorbitol-6-phosphatase